MLTSASPARLTSGQRAAYERDGFVILKSLFSSNEMDELRGETDRLLTERRDLIDPFNLRCRFMPHHESGEPLFEVFDPVNEVAPVCQRFCDDPRIVDTVAALYGEPACLFKDKLIFKPAGAKGYQLHQDYISWKSFPTSFLTVIVAIDAADASNGATEVFPGYHRQGCLSARDGNYHQLA